jgi:hypothetical protein
MDIMSSYGMQYPSYQNGYMQQPQQMPQMPQQPPQPPYVDPRQYDTPSITLGGNNGEEVVHFTVSDEENSNKGSMVIIDNTIPEPPASKKRRSKESRESTDIVRPSSAEKVSGTVEESPTSYTYMETTNMLRDTLNQIDSLNSELVQEFTAVKNNKYLKNKYNTMVGLSENIGSLLNARISAIREINSSITKSNDLDYKKLKDMRAAQADVTDDKYIADLYQSFLQNPQMQAAQPQMPQIDPSVFGSGIVRANITQGDVTGNNQIDAGYLNYLSNLSPEQNLMRYENDPNVKQVVVYDAKTGNKFFQVMNTATGEVIPNVPVYDTAVFMPDTTIDIKNRIAKNLNLRETFPLVIINEDSATMQY